MLSFMRRKHASLPFLFFFQVSFAGHYENFDPLNETEEGM